MLETNPYPRMRFAFLGECVVLQEQREDDSEHDCDAYVSGQPCERGEDCSPEQGRTFRFVQERTGQEERERREQDEGGFGHYPCGDPGEGNRQREGQASPDDKKTRAQMPAEPMPGDEDRQPEADGIDGASHVQRVEDAEAARRQQQGEERRPPVSMVLDEDVPGQQPAGRDEVVDRVRVQRGAIVDLARQHEPRAEHGDGDQEQGEAVGADAGKVRVHEEWCDGHANRFASFAPCPGPGWLTRSARARSAIPSCRMRLRTV